MTLRIRGVVQQCVAEHAHRFDAHESGVVPMRGAHPICIGEHVRIDPKQVAAYCVRELELLDEDLLLVAGVIWFVDRSTKRTENWERDLQVRIAVHEPDAWRSAAPKLATCLGLVTGDRWVFEFVARRRPRIPPTAPLFDNAWPGLVLPYSGGLDSYLHLATLPSEERSRAWLLTAENSTRARGLVSRTIAAAPTGPSPHRLGIPVRLSGLEEPERSFRTRTFVFFVCAAIAWKSSGADRIEIAENGQGALGPSLVTIGTEYPYLATHPAFTSLLAEFLHALWGRRPKFVHPRVWHTKGEVLALAAAHNVQGRWEQTRSCSRNIRRFKRRITDHELGRDCGICGGCMLRRLAAKVAGVEDRTTYVWSDLRAADLDRAPARSVRRDLTKAQDRKIAATSLVCLTSLAEAAARPDELLYAEARLLANSLTISPAEALTRLRRLLARHMTEWRGFTDSLPRDSWVRAVEMLPS